MTIIRSHPYAQAGLQNTWAKLSPAPTNSGTKQFPERVSHKSAYVSLARRLARRKAGAWAGIHGMAIPLAPNAAPGQFAGQPLWGGVLFTLEPRWARGPRPYGHWLRSLALLQGENACRDAHSDLSFGHSLRLAITKRVAKPQIRVTVYRVEEK